MSEQKMTEFRAIARTATNFESAVEKLQAAGIKNRAVAIRFVQLHNGAVYNQWSAKQHNVQRF